MLTIVAHAKNIIYFYQWKNKDKENDKMSEEVITNDVTKDGANAATNKGEVVKANSGAVAQANKDMILVISLFLVNIELLLKVL